MKFYDRIKEIKQLELISMKADSNSQFTVIIGRRRIGKTLLLLKAFEDQTFLYFFVSRKSEILLCKDFQREIEEKLNFPILGEAKEFVKLFEFIVEISKEQKITLIIDEFQEFTKINPSIYSDMQKIWDLNHRSTKLNLIVSGSVVSIMSKLFENANEPLFGRATSILNLKPFSIETIETILKDYSPAPSQEDLLALYSFTGGVAKYVQILMDNNIVTKDQMINFICSENSLFINEGKNILIEEFGKEYITYFSILSAISSGINTRSGIQDLLQKEIGGYLNRLEEYFQIISKIRPFGSKNDGKILKYKIQDNFLNFWFRFIYKYFHMIEIGAFEALQTIIHRDYPSFSGLMLEKYFIDRAKESQNFTQIGQYWDRKGTVEIDFIAVNELDKHILFAEIKRNPEKAGIQKLQTKAAIFIEDHKLYKTFTVDYKIWSLNEI